MNGNVNMLWTLIMQRHKLRLELDSTNNALKVFDQMNERKFGIDPVDYQLKSQFISNYLFDFLGRSLIQIKCPLGRE